MSATVTVHALSSLFSKVSGTLGDRGGGILLLWGGVLWTNDCSTRAQKCCKTVPSSRWLSSSVPCLFWSKNLVLNNENGTYSVTRYLFFTSKVWWPGNNTTLNVWLTEWIVVWNPPIIYMLWPTGAQGREKGMTFMHNRIGITIYNLLGSGWTAQWGSLHTIYFQYESHLCLEEINWLHNTYGAIVVSLCNLQCIPNSHIVTSLPWKM